MKEKYELNVVEVALCVQALREASSYTRVDARRREYLRLAKELTERVRKDNGGDRVE